MRLVTLCLVCGEPVDLTARHVVIARTVETQRRGVATVHDAVVLVRLHEEHADRLRDLEVA